MFFGASMISSQHGMALGRLSDSISHTIPLDRKLPPGRTSQTYHLHPCSEASTSPHDPGSESARSVQLALSLLEAGRPSLATECHEMPQTRTPKGLKKLQGSGLGLDPDVGGWRKCTNKLCKWR